MPSSQKLARKSHFSDENDREGVSRAENGSQRGWKRGKRAGNGDPDTLGRSGREKHEKWGGKGKNEAQRGWEAGTRFQIGGVDAMGF